MIIFARSFEEFKKYMGNALVNNFPESFILYVFIDEEMKQPVIEVSKPLIKSEMKFTLDCEYRTAASVVNEFLADKKKSDFDYNRKNTPIGLKIRIKEDDRKMDFMNVFNNAFRCERFNVSKTDAQTITNKLANLLLSKKAMYFVNGGFDCEDMADAFIAGCSAMYECMMDKISDSVHCVLNAPADIGDETLTVNEAAEIFKYLLDNMKPDKAQTTIEDVTNAYENFENANLKMLADLAAQRKIAVLNNSKTPFIDALENDNKISSEDARNARVLYNCVCEESDDRMKYALLEHLCTLNSNNELLIFAFDTLYSIGKVTKDETTKKNIKKLFKKYNYSVDGSNDRKAQMLLNSYNDTMSRIVFVDGVK